MHVVHNFITTHCHCTTSTQPAHNQHTLAPAPPQIAQEILQDTDTEAISGDRIVDILDATPLCPVLPYAANGATNMAASVPTQDTAAARAAAMDGVGSGVGAASVATAGETGFAGPAQEGSRVGSVSFTRMREALTGASS